MNHFANLSVRGSEGRGESAFPKPEDFLMSATSSEVFTSDATAGSTVSDNNPVRGWTRLAEAFVRSFPERSVVVSFLIGVLLRFRIVRELLGNLFRLTMWLAGPAFFAFAGWRLYQLMKEPPTPVKESAPDPINQSGISPAL